MIKTEKLLGTLIASAVATITVSGIALAAEGQTAKQNAAYCQNNSCKGHSACQGHGNNSCKGENACKGVGFLTATTPGACKKSGGKWTTEHQG